MERLQNVMFSTDSVLWWVHFYIVEIIMYVLTLNNVKFLFMWNFPAYHVDMLTQACVFGSTCTDFFLQHMDSESAAATAIDNLHHSLFEGKQINVEVSVHFAEMWLSLWKAWSREGVNGRAIKA